MAISIEQTFAHGKPVVVDARTWADPEAVWRLLADPDRWPDWSPHITAVERSRTGVVAAGERLRIHGVAWLRVAARVTTVTAPRRWDFVADLPGPWSLHSAHEVLPAPDDGTGTRVVVTMRVLGPGAALLNRSALVAYTPLARVAVQQLAALAAAQAPSSQEA